MPSNSTVFNQILNIAPSEHMQTIHKVIKDTSPSQEHQYHHQLKQELEHLGISSIFNQILNIAPSGHVETFQNIINDTIISQEHPASSKSPAMSAIFESVLNFLIPSSSTDINQILNIAPSEHVQTLYNGIKDTSPNQEHQNHHQLLQEL